MNLYYNIWTDCIKKAQSQPRNKDDWKVYTLLFMSIAMTFNLIFLLFIFSEINIINTIPILKINITGITYLDGFLRFFISYLLPFLLINYFFIFYRNRYLKILQKYKYYNGRLFIVYFLGSIGILLIYFFIAFLIIKVL